MRIKKNERCETRDGVELAADIYLPDEEGEYPALLAYSPYGKDIQDSVLFLPKQSREESTMWDGTIEAGDIEFTTENGYAHVVADVRGTGDSAGRCEGFFDKAGQDGYDLVEWIADRPWCNGKVGGIGRSWFGTNQLLLAAENPPSLEAVFPSGVFTDLYREFAYHGGILNMFLYGLWDGRGGDSGIVDNNWVSRERERNGKEVFQEQLESKLEDPDFREYPNLYQLLQYPEKNPLFADLVLNSTDTEFYSERSPHERLDQVDVPIYISGAWAGTHTRPVFTAEEELSVDERRYLMTPPRLLERPYHEYKEEMLRWYDHWLKDEDTGITEEPQVKAYVRGADQWRFEDQLIPERTEWTERYLRNHGRLLEHPDPVDDLPPSGFTQQPPNVGKEIENVVFRTEPFESETEMMGPAALHFHAAIDNEDTTWMATLADVNPSGEEFVLSRGYLRASHRGIDEERSEPYRPYHPHDEPEPVEPGAVYEYHLEFPPISNLFKQGNRLQMTIKSMEMPFSDTSDLPPGSHHLPHSRTISHRIYHDNDRQSRLVLPVIPHTDPDRWIEPDDPSHPGTIR